MSTKQRKRTWEEKMKDVEELESRYKRRPLCAHYRPQLSKPWQPSSVWKLFPRLTQAIHFAKNCKEEVHIFALEKHPEKKQRIYLVTTYTELWFYYSKHHKTSLMHCYEVIPETAVCKLYFDLEFYIPTNPEADGKQMVTDLIEFVCTKLDEYYEVKCSAEDILNLDSSTEEKFSSHLIFQLHNAAFKNNIELGNFLKIIFQPAILLTKNEDAVVQEKQVASVSQCYRAATDDRNQMMTKNESQSWQMNAHKEVGKETSHSKKNPDLSFLIVNGKQGGKQLFVDLGVYSKNRNFRLYKSSKAGNCVILDIAEDNKFVPKPAKNSCIEEQYFFSALICNVRFLDCFKILTCEDQKEKREISRCVDGNILNCYLDPMGGYEWSPYPEIDNFVLSLVNKDNIRGGIRRWNYFSLEQLLVYDITNYRWCENIGRAHKSNNIMIVVDLKNEHWYQKCHDPICRAENFKSECYPLPAEVCLPFLFEEDEECVYIMDENGNIEEKSTTYSDHTSFSTVTYLTPVQESRETNAEKNLSIKWEEEEADISFFETSKDVELAEAVDTFQLQKNWIDEIPDEILVDALIKHEIKEIKE